MATTFAMPPTGGRDAYRLCFTSHLRQRDSALGLLLHKGFSSYNPRTESRRGPASTKDLQGSTPIIPEWKVAHDFSQTCIQTSREAEDAHGR
jgi:hypothetical protein